ncbi:MAG: F0F1 ATP synthase subunit C [Erysipelotrichaceae bacterium]|nr:F0F1 ATP synthase subunit C [Erysipelotrichaceae bacterium]
MEVSIGQGLIAIGAAIAVFTGFATGFGEGSVAKQAVESVGKNPEAINEIRTLMILGDAISETCAIYGLLVAILLIFVF